ncbi:MAG: glycine-rich protein [Oscillospiraceae bacterium]|nr:glycine-rich protein [Oscillospiraceae bacterium]
MAVFAPLLAAVVVLTGILSLLPARTAESPLEEFTVTGVTQRRYTSLGLETYNNSNIAGYLDSWKVPGMSIEDPVTLNPLSSGKNDHLVIYRLPLGGYAVPDTVKWNGRRNLVDHIVLLYTNEGWEQIGTVTATSNEIHIWKLSPAQQAGAAGKYLYIAFFADKTNPDLDLAGITNASTSPFSVIAAFDSLPQAIFNRDPLPSPPPMVDDNLSAVDWTETVDHTGYDTGSTLAYTRETSTKFNGYETPDHVVFGDNVVRFFGYGRDPYMDYVFCDNNASFEGVAFKLTPVQMIFHTFYQTGFLFGGVMNGGNYTGYALILECGNSEGMLETGTASLSLYYINNEPWDTDQFTPGSAATTRTLIATYKTGIKNRDNTPIDVNIKITGGNTAEVYIDGTLRSSIGVAMPGQGFGFFTGYYEHACTILSVVQYDYVALTGLPPVPMKLTTVTARFYDADETWTEIAASQTEQGYAGMVYDVIPPKNVTINDEDWVFVNSLPGKREGLVYKNQYYHDVINLYYRKIDGDITASKSASVGGVSNNGAEQEPVKVNPGGTIDYTISAQKVEPTRYVLRGIQFDSTSSPLSNAMRTNIEDAKTLFGIDSPYLSNAAYNYSTYYRYNPYLTPTPTGEGISCIAPVEILEKADMVNEADGSPVGDLPPGAYTMSVVFVKTPFNGGSAERPNSAQWPGVYIGMGADFYYSDSGVSFVNTLARVHPGNAKLHVPASELSTSGGYGLTDPIEIGEIRISASGRILSGFQWQIHIPQVDDMIQMFPIVEDKAGNSVTIASIVLTPVESDSYFFPIGASTGDYQRSAVTNFNACFSQTVATTLYNKDIKMGSYSGNSTTPPFSAVAFYRTSNVTNNLVTLNRVEMADNLTMPPGQYTVGFNFLQSDIGGSVNFTYNGATMTLVSASSPSALNVGIGNVSNTGPNTGTSVSLYHPYTRWTTETAGTVWIDSEGYVTDQAGNRGTADKPAFCFSMSAPIHSSFALEGVVLTPVSAPDMVVEDLLPAGLTYQPGSTSGAGEPVTTTEDGREKLTWTLPGNPSSADISFTANIDPAAKGVFENTATVTVGLAVAMTNPTYHTTEKRMTERFVEHGTGTELKPDETTFTSASSYQLPLISYGDITYDDEIYAYYGYSLLSEGDATVHESQLLNHNISGMDAEVITLHFRKKPKVTVHFADGSGTVVQPAVTADVAYGADYTVPDYYLNDIGSYMYYKAVNGTPAANPFAGTVTPPAALTNITADTDITLYFTQSGYPVTVHFVELYNSMNMLQSDRSFIVDTGGTFTPGTVSPSLFAPVTPDNGMEREYSYYGYSIGSSTTVIPGQPPQQTGINAPLEISLYFNTSYSIIEQFHTTDEPRYEPHTGGCDPSDGHTHDRLPPVELKPDNTVNIPGGFPYSGNPPATINLHSEDWDYVGYKAGDDNGALNYGYPSDPAITSVNGDFTFVYVYEKPDESSEITVSKSASVSSETQLTAGQKYSYTIGVDGANAAPTFTSEDFEYTGAVEPFTAPVAGTYKLEVWGAQGKAFNTNAGTGGKGGYSAGTVTLAAEETIYVYVGGSGKAVVNGSNGGNVNSAATGGGGTDIRLSSGASTLGTRIIVAGGGGSGGTGSNATGGYGGSNSTNNTDGGSGAAGGVTGTNPGGTSGTQSAGGQIGGSLGTAGTVGVFGIGGNGGYSSTTRYGGAAGGGWYGGGGGRAGSTSTNGSGGSGGSGYVFTSGSNKTGYGANIPNSKYYLTDTVMIAGNVSMPNPAGGANIPGKDGDGYARITLVAASGPLVPDMTITDLLPQGLQYVSSDVAPVSEDDFVGNRQRLTWELSGQSSVTVEVEVLNNGLTFINTATMEIDETTYFTNATYHRSGVKITERFRDKEDIEGTLLAPDNAIIQAAGTAYTEKDNVNGISGWTYWGWKLESGAATEGTPSPATIISSVSGGETITYLYTEAAAPPVGPEPAIVTLNALKKATGGSMSANQFIFELFDCQESVSVGTSNPDAGASSPVIFGAFIFTEEDTYVYLMKESFTGAVNGWKGGWKLDDTCYRIEIEVEDVNNVLIPTVTYVECDSSGVSLGGSPKTYTDETQSSWPVFTNIFGGPVLPMVGGSGEGAFTAAALAGMVFLGPALFIYRRSRRGKRLARLE